MNVFIYRIKKDAPRNTSSNILARKLIIDGNPIDKFVTSLRPLQRIPRGSIVFNYGYQKDPQWLPGRNDLIFLNHSDNVKKSVNKELMYPLLKNNNIPTFEWAFRKEDINWHGDTLVRTETDAHSADGIKIIHEGDPVPDAPLYTKFKPLNLEQRYFVCKNKLGIYKIVGVIEKRPMNQDQLLRWRVRRVDPRIRCFRRGWDYSDRYSGFNQNVVDLVINTMKAFKLDFGAIDIGVGENFNDLVVVETNTEPGLAHVSQLCLNNLADGVVDMIKSYM